MKNNDLTDVQHEITQFLIGEWEAAEDHSDTPLYQAFSEGCDQDFYSTQRIFEASVDYVIESLLFHECADELLQKIVEARSKK